MSHQPDASEIVHANPWFRVARRVTGANEWFRIEAPDSAMVVGTTDDGRLLLVRGHRPADPTAETFEFPGGIVEPGEEPADAAVRELAEETGCTASGVVLLGSFLQAPAISSAQCHVFGARVAAVGAARLEAGEEWSSVTVDPAKLSSLVRSGQIRDGGTLAAMALRLAGTRRD